MSGEYFDKLPIWCPADKTMLLLTKLKTESNAEAEINIQRTQPINKIIKTIVRVLPLMNIADRKLRRHDKPEIGYLFVIHVIIKIILEMVYS